MPMNPNYIVETLSRIDYLKTICDLTPELQEHKANLVKLEQAVLKEQAKVKKPFGDKK